MTQTPLEKAQRLALMLLDDVDPVTTADVVEKVDDVLNLVPGARPDRERLIREVEAACNVYIPEAQFLEGRDEDHLDWLPDRRGEIDWRIWRRYQRSLRNRRDGLGGRQPAWVR